MPFRAAEMMTMQKPVQIQAMTTISRIVLRLRVSMVIHGNGPAPKTPATAFSVPVWGSPGGR